MFSPEVIERRITLASESLIKHSPFDSRGNAIFKPGFRLQYHTVEQVAQANSHLDDLIGEDGQPTRPFTVEEARWIRNERALCRCDFSYWCSRYAFIINWLGQLVRFSPNVAQQIALRIFADLEKKQIAILMQFLKARQLGVTTLTELIVLHRALFFPRTNALVASSDPDKSRTMAEKMEIAMENLPYWMLPTLTSYHKGELIEFKKQNSGISIQHGTQMSGMARGTTPTVFHLSEVSDYRNPSALIDASLLRAVHDSPWIFGVLESTAAGRNNYWHNKWKFNVENWPLGRSRLCPAFLPWFVGMDIYPTPTFLRARPVPEDWRPLEITTAHANRAKEYVRSNSLLSKSLGSSWEMLPEQQWFWEVTRAEYEADNRLHEFYQELCLVKGSKVSTTRGMLPIEEVRVGDKTEGGRVLRSIKVGRRRSVVLRTHKGRTLGCTPDHRIALAEGGWEAAQNTVGKVIKLSAPIFGTFHSPELGRLLGYFMGDGAWSRGSLRIACDLRDKEVHADVEYLLTTYHCQPLVTKNGGMMDFQSRDLSKCNWLLFLGLLQKRPNAENRSSRSSRSSKYKRRICVPDLVWVGDAETVRSFLSALFECGGHAAKRYAQISLSKSSNVAFLRDIQLLLLGFGLNSRISADPKGMWRLTLNGTASDLFHERIGFISSRKRQSAKRTGCSSYHNSRRKPEPNELVDIVTCVEVADEEDVYDLTIEQTHCFGANGILVHNCADDKEAFQSSNISVFSVDTLSRFRENCNKMPVGVYGLRAPQAEVPLILQPSDYDIDRNIPPVEVRCKWNPTRPADNYTLYPLLHHSPAPFDPLGKIIIYEAPRQNKIYGLGTDVGMGLGQDRSVIEILRKGDMEENDSQVAEYASPLVNSFALWPFNLALGTLYSTPFNGKIQQAKQVIEMAANGENTQLELWKRGWRNFHQWVRYDKKKIIESKATRLGWYTLEWSRRMMLDMLLDALNNGWLDINSPWFVDEMADLELDLDRMRLAAVSGAHDDRIMAQGIVLFSMHALETRHKDSWITRERMGRRDPNPQYARYSEGDQGRDTSDVRDVRSDSDSYAYEVVGGNDPGRGYRSITLSGLED